MCVVYMHKYFHSFVDFFSVAERSMLHDERYFAENLGGGGDGEEGADMGHSVGRKKNKLDMIYKQGRQTYTICVNDGVIVTDGKHFDGGILNFRRIRL